MKNEKRKMKNEKRSVLSTHYSPITTHQLIAPDPQSQKRRR